VFFLHLQIFITGAKQFDYGYALNDLLLGFFVLFGYELLVFTNFENIQPLLP
jgi:hypothetical protein